MRSWRSSTVTSYPSRASNPAVASPATPAPMITTFLLPMAVISPAFDHCQTAALAPRFEPCDCRVRESADGVILRNQRPQSEPTTQKISRAPHNRPGAHRKAKVEEPPGPHRVAPVPPPPSAL